MSLIQALVNLNGVGSVAPEEYDFAEYWHAHGNRQATLDQGRLTGLLVAYEKLKEENALLLAAIRPPGWVLTELRADAMTELAVAIGDLSAAMGSPAVFSRLPQTIKSRTVRLAAGRFRAAQLNDRNFVAGGGV